LNSILVANRGEIARRIFRTASRMGLRTVAVYSDADAGEPFVREADEAIHIGPAPALESYLSIERVLDAARESRADLVHPGYGFLAEDPAFATAVARAGLAFVGPSADVLALAGSKAGARELASRSGVPVLPGFAETERSDAALISAAHDVKFPVMLKPSAGGGGKGMYIARSEAELREALAASRRIATAAFGDDRLILERYVERARHLEVQLLGDAHGRIVAVGERDCSAQRRHQKVVEEAPAPGIADAQRERLLTFAAALGRAAGYVSAGTAEFVMDPEGQLFFLEINARLQVEHPVTEAVFGLDLVEQQIRVALGERLNLATPRATGHAIEARIYAEDPAAGFVPSTGRVVHVRWPEGVRVDAGVEEGSTVTPYYDPLLAKLVVHAKDRPAAVEGLASALERTEILGLRTNLEFLGRLVRHPVVREGTVTTDLIERQAAVLAPAAGPVPAEPRVLAAAAALEVSLARPGRSDPWSSLVGWRHLQAAPASLIVRDEHLEDVVGVHGSGPFRAGQHSISRDGTEPHAWLVDGVPAAAALDGSRAWVAWRGATYVLETGPRERTIEAATAGEAIAPMPGAVVAIAVRSGQRVRRGDTLVVVEAMKMEMPVRAPADGTVRAVLCGVGDQVERGQRLVDLEANGS
jgi:acetyl/propionyl-CoA carboxylase alpha subunit